MATIGTAAGAAVVATTGIVVAGVAVAVGTTVESTEVAT